MTVDAALHALHGERVLVTGALGSIGRPICDVLSGAGITVLATDLLQGLDVRDRDCVARVIAMARPTLILHLAGAKHAPEGELDPWSVMETNVAGTRNVLDASTSARVVLASTCKACDPETVYGASKLVAERMVLNEGGSVARFYNVPESSGNVFRLWEELPADEPLPVTPCSRFFVPVDRVVELFLWATVLEPGRYTVHPGRPWFMYEIARREYPGRETVPVPPRRGDRTAEPLHARSERFESSGVDGILRVVSTHDAEEPVVSRAAELEMAL